METYIFTKTSSICEVFYLFIEFFQSDFFLITVPCLFSHIDFLKMLITFYIFLPCILSPVIACFSFLSLVKLALIFQPLTHTLTEDPFTLSRCLNVFLSYHKLEAHLLMHIEHLLCQEAGLMSVSLALQNANKNLCVCVCLCMDGCVPTSVLL